MHRHIMIVSPRGTADALPALRAVWDWSLSRGDWPWLTGPQHSHRFWLCSRDVMFGAMGDGDAQGEMDAMPRGRDAALGRRVSEVACGSWRSA